MTTYQRLQNVRLCSHSGSPCDWCISSAIQGSFVEGWIAGVKAAAKRMAGDGPQENEFCRLADHMLGNCECEERSTALIEMADKGPQTQEQPT